MKNGICIWLLSFQPDNKIQYLIYCCYKSLKRQMFEEQVQTPSLKDINPESYFASSQSNSLNVQYQICSKFMKMASEQLYQKELQIINSTSRLLDRVHDSCAQKDISTTQESMTVDNFLDDDESFSQPSKSRILLRKSKSNNSIKRSDNGLNEALREVQRNCSQQTSSMLSNMAGEYRRTKQKLACSQKHEKELKRLETRYSTIQEELLINRKRVSDLEKENKSQQEQVSSLKKRLRQATHPHKESSLSLSKSSGNIRKTEINASDKIRSYLEVKQIQIFKKQKEIKSIQDQIQQSMSHSFSSEDCQKCCQMMKRVKEGIMRYRAFLEEEANTAELFYNSFKKQFYC